ncbi:hypothetical protein [Candidatus Thioglobus sp.]|uniref:hypothetical protein n=1 Tax=Candidatus Thioglobus sp. TaxID=2026721 RepID=UPI003D0A5742
MKLIIPLVITFLTSTAIAGGKLSVFFTQNNIERQLTWQCAEIDECIEILQSRIEENQGCDPKVFKIVLERVYIPGMDDA